jgi:deoxyadenosine kinase
MSNLMCRPNVIIYLDVSPERSLERIHARSREVESGITLAYLSALHEGYEEFIRNISKVIPVIRVDYDRFATAEEMARVIQENYLNHDFLKEAVRPEVPR